MSVSPLSPEERWSQQFMNSSIGPEPQLGGLTNWAPPAPPAPRITVDLAPPPMQDQAVPQPEPIDRLPMGERIGRAPRRSWFGRLFQGS